MKNKTNSEIFDTAQGIQSRRMLVFACGLAIWMVGCADPNSNHPSPTQLSSRIASRGIPQEFGGNQLADSVADDGTVAVVSRGRKTSSIARVNGREIDARSFVKTLVDSRGLMLLQQLIYLEAVRAEADKRKLSVSESEVEAEYDLTLKDVSDTGDGQSLTAAQRELLIDKWTQQNGVTHVELAIAMARQALLRKMATADVRVSSDDVRKEHARVFGEKVEVRHLQLPARRTYSRVKARIDRGDPFEDLVTDYSVNSLTKARGGLLPPFTNDDPTVPRAFAKVAFELKEGEISSLFESEGNYHLIKLEQRISAESGSLGDTRNQLEKSVLGRRIAERMDSMGRELLMDANIRIDESTMRKQYAEQKKRGVIKGPDLKN